MPKVKKVGVVVDDLSASQLSYHIIKNINKQVEESDTDFVAFFQNSTASMLPMHFSSMCINEIWSFEYIIQAFNKDDIQLIARSKDYAKAIKNYCNKDVVGVVDNFNIKQLMEIINHE